jgi:hypothetical protein
MRPWSAVLAFTTCLVGCKFAPGGGVFAVPQNWVDVSPDARQEGAGKPTSPPEDELSREMLRTFEPIHNPQNLRFSPTRPEDIRLLVGRDHLDDYVVLGIVHAGDSGGIGSSADDTVRDLRRAAALVGAAVILDVQRVAWTHNLVGIAARKREDSPARLAGANL